MQRFCKSKSISCWCMAPANRGRATRTARIRKNWFLSRPRFLAASLRWTEQRQRTKGPALQSPWMQCRNGRESLEIFRCDCGCRRLIDTPQITGRNEDCRSGCQTFNLLHLACDAHKSASCIKHSLAGSESEVSGLINSALSLGELGVLQRLRDLLTALFFNELRVHPDQAPDDEGLQQYRKAVFEQFLPLQGDKCVVNQKRRKILETMLNGDLRQAELQHYCPLGATCCANDPQQTMSTMALYVSWALLPCQQATISRKIGLVK